MKKISSPLYNAARNFGKLASKVNDVETFLTLNPGKIFNRFKNKRIRKFSYKTIERIIHKNKKK